MKDSARSVIVGEVEPAGPDDWRARAACLGMSDLMFDPEQVHEAVEVCRECPVIGECWEAVMADDSLRRAYAFVGATVGGLPPSQLRKRRKDAIAKPVPVHRCSYCNQAFVPKTRKIKFCSDRCRNKRQLAQKKQWEKARYLPSEIDPSTLT